MRRDHSLYGQGRLSNSVARSSSARSPGFGHLSATETERRMVGGPAEQQREQATPAAAAATAPAAAPTTAGAGDGAGAAEAAAAASASESAADLEAQALQGLANLAQRGGGMDAGAGAGAAPIRVSLASVLAPQSQPTLPPAQAVDTNAKRRR